MRAFFPEGITLRRADVFRKRSENRRWKREKRVERREEKRYNTEDTEEAHRVHGEEGPGKGEVGDGELPSRDKLRGIFSQGNRGRQPCLNTSRMRDSR
jgi:hypothetical protein